MIIEHIIQNDFTKVKFDDIYFFKKWILPEFYRAVQVFCGYFRVLRFLLRLHKRFDVTGTPKKAYGFKQVDFLQIWLYPHRSNKRVHGSINQKELTSKLPSEVEDHKSLTLDRGWTKTQLGGFMLF